ncbi:iron chelate uptake ABC transporter family permease subunit [Actinotalea ferrariae]|nr:iron chelate uptake ABC transporter family permease subunit [Actinotalea ferrariae]
MPAPAAGASASTAPADRRPARVLAVLGLVAALCVVGFLTVDARGAWDFVLPFRGVKVVALLLVAYAIAVSTVLFQTVTENRILTPSIMGFDALYVALQTGLVFAVGSARLAAVDPHLRFAVEVLLMVGLAGLLFRWLFTGARRSLHLLLLAGIVIGVLLRSVSSFLQRLIDPNEFAVLQDALFASFNAVDTELLGLAALLVAGASVVAWRERRAYDVLLLGHPTATVLGVDHARTVTRVLVVVAVLVSVSTALVGPVTFFGLLVAHLAYQLVGSHQHRHVLPAAALLAAITLIGGQAVLEHVLGLDTALSVVVELLGGLVLLTLLLREGRR